MFEMVTELWTRGLEVRESPLALRGPLPIQTSAAPPVCGNSKTCLSKALFVQTYSDAFDPANLQIPSFLREVAEFSYKSASTMLRHCFDSTNILCYDES